MQPCSFRDSCVTELDPTCLLEEATAFPLTIHPMLVGSGLLGIGLDASGLQAVDSRMAPAFGLEPSTDDLYILRHGYISNHLGYQHDGYNHMPCGYLTWRMRLGDGTVIDTASLPQAATCWRRTLYLDEAVAETTMVLHGKLRLRIKVYLPYLSEQVHIEVGLRGYNPSNQPLDTALPVEMHIGVQLALRDGKPIFDDVQRTGDALELTANAHERYQLRYRWSADAGIAVEQSDDWYGVAFTGDVQNEEVVFRCALDLAAPEVAASWQPERVRAAHCEDWQRFWARTAKIDIGETRQEFLYANSLYLLRIGQDYRKGGTGGLLMPHQQYWYGCNFWDMTFITDGLIRAGAPELAEQFIVWLAQVVRPTGRPFPWMMIYDGTTPLSDEADLGILVNLAFATAALRVLRVQPDATLFHEAIWPVCERVCQYLVEMLFNAEDDHYILGFPCGHDVGEVSEAVINETYTALWGVSILAKCLEVADARGLTPAWAETARAIVAAPYFEHDGEMYYHARNVPVREYSFASWLPNLLYPTEGFRFLDADHYARTRAQADFPTLYMERQGCFQPWTYFWGALSDFRRGDRAAGQQLIEGGIRHAYGPGFFCEVGPFQYGASLPPYPTPHGSYLAAISEQFIAGDFWEPTITLFINAPDAWRSRTVTAANINAGNGVTLVTLSASPAGITAELTGHGTYECRCALPRDLIGQPYRVLCNGQPVTATTIAPDAIAFSLALTTEGVTLVVERDAANA